MERKVIMKKKVWSTGLLCAMFAMACALLISGCKPEVDTGKTESSWLVGSWSNAETGAAFTIKDDMTFEADVYPIPNEKARVSGRLDNSNSKLGPNEFQLFDLVAAASGDPDDTYTGNDFMPQEMLNSFNGSLVASLIPNESKTEFEFKSSNTPVADLFFGGNYKKN